MALMRVSANGGRGLTMQSTFLPTVRITRSVTWNYITFLRGLSTPPDLSPEFTLETVAEGADASLRLRTSLCWRRTARLTLDQRTNYCISADDFGRAAPSWRGGFESYTYERSSLLESARQRSLHTYRKDLRAPGVHVSTPDRGCR